MRDVVPPRPYTTISNTRLFNPFNELPFRPLPVPIPLSPCCPIARKRTRLIAGVYSADTLALKGPALDLASGSPRAAAVASLTDWCCCCCCCVSEVGGAKRPTCRVTTRRLDDEVKASSRRNESRRDWRAASAAEASEVKGRATEEVAGTVVRHG